MAVQSRRPTARRQSHAHMTPPKRNYSSLRIVAHRESRHLTHTLHCQSPQTSRGECLATFLQHENFPRNRLRREMTPPPAPAAQNCPCLTNGAAQSRVSTPRRPEEHPRHGDPDDEDQEGTRHPLECLGNQPASWACCCIRPCPYHRPTSPADPTTGYEPPAGRPCLPSLPSPTASQDAAPLGALDRQAPRHPPPPSASRRRGPARRSAAISAGCSVQFL